MLSGASSRASAASRRFAHLAARRSAAFSVDAAAPAAAASEGEQQLQQQPPPSAATPQHSREDPGLAAWRNHGVQLGGGIQYKVPMRDINFCMREVGVAPPRVARCRSPLRLCSQPLAGRERCVRAAC